MRRLATAVVLTGAMGLGFSLEAHAQALIMPTGPMSLRPAAVATATKIEVSGDE